MYIEDLEKGEKPTNKKLYEEQMELLKMFLERGAISKEQFEKSSTDLTIKMGYKENNK